jgi:hypothetical protein
MKKKTGDHLSYAANLSKVWGPPLLSSNDLSVGAKEARSDEDELVSAEATAW